MGISYLRIGNLLINVVNGWIWKGVVLRDWGVFIVWGVTI
jgi:hypothetical protein